MTDSNRPDQLYSTELWSIVRELQARVSAQEEELVRLRGAGIPHPVATGSTGGVRDRSSRTLSRGTLLKVAVAGVAGVATAAGAGTTSAMAACTLKPFVALTFDAFGDCPQDYALSTDHPNTDPFGAPSLYKYGVNVQGNICGVYGEGQAAARTVTDRIAPTGTGVYGVGDSIGVMGEVHGSAGDGVFGSTAAAGTYAGVHGHGSGGYGVRGNSVSNAGVFGESETWNGVEGHTQSLGTSALYGENQGDGYGVYGRSMHRALGGSLVLGSGNAVTGESGTGIGVHGIGSTGVSGTSTDPLGNGVSGTGIVNGTSSSTGVAGTGDIGVAGSGTDGVVGTSTAASLGGTGVKGVASVGSIGVAGIADAGTGIEGESNSGDGVHGFSGSAATPGHGYGGHFAALPGALAPLCLDPSGSVGHPTSYTHSVGEFFVDSAGSLFICTVSGTPGTWKQVLYGAAPTDARVASFAVRRNGDRLHFRWHIGDTHGVVGFDLYAGSRRLNGATIRPSRRRSYSYEATWQGRETLRLHVLLRDGQVIVVDAKQQ